MGKLYTQWVLKHGINLHFGFTREGGDNKKGKKKDKNDQIQRHSTKIRVFLLVGYTYT